MKTCYIAALYIYTCKYTGLTYKTDGGIIIFSFFCAYLLVFFWRLTEGEGGGGTLAKTKELQEKFRVAYTSRIQTL